MIVKLSTDGPKIFTTYENDTYVAIINKMEPNWAFRLMDLIHYQKELNQSVDLRVSTENLKEAEIIYHGHDHKGPLRAYENKVMVHSTTLASWSSIKKSYKLKSWNLATKDKDLNENEPIGKQLKDPEDFLDYVMLGDFGFYNEIVVLSKQNNKLIFDPNMVYEPGVRIYINAEKLAKDQLLTRDGLHYKVKDEIDLNKYMIAYITADDLENKEYTPLTFSNAADQWFKSNYTT